MIFSFSLVPSYNQPRFCYIVSWESEGITLEINMSNFQPSGIYIDTNNTIYVANSGSDQILTWVDGNISISSSIPGINCSYAIFASTTDTIYLGSNIGILAGSAWPWNITNTTILLTSGNACFGLFVDITNTLYCSIRSNHYVVKKWLNDGKSTSAIIAGRDNAGSNSELLNSPRGIFVDINLDLYVADCGNNRVQLFKLGQIFASTVAGNGAPTTITLSCPTGVVLDGDKSLYIVDSQNHRIVGSSSNGFRCIIGCFGRGSQSNQLNNPSHMAFDSDGNIFVTDLDNKRIQKFPLATNSCSKFFSYAK